MRRKRDRGGVTGIVSPRVDGRPMCWHFAARAPLIRMGRVAAFGNSRQFATVRMHAGRHRGFGMRHLSSVAGMAWRERHAEIRDGSHSTAARYTYEIAHRIGWLRLVRTPRILGPSEAR